MNKIHLSKGGDNKQTKIKKPTVALVHDFLLYCGGAEKVLMELKRMYRDSPVYTLLKNDSIDDQTGSDERSRFKANCFNLMKFDDVKTSFLQKFPGFFRRRHRWLLPFMSTAIETFDLRNYDLVISSSSAFAKGIVVKSRVKHICYMHAPMRYVWDWNREYLEEKKLKGRTKLFTRLFLNYLRMWDRISAERPDYLIANSCYTAERIRKYYRRKAKVIYPPVEVEKFIPTKENAGYFLTVSRLVPYKRVDLLVQVFQKLKLPLVIVGDGPDLKKIQRMVSGDKLIKVLGWVDDDKKIKLFEKARAFITATEDDFNITAVEAMAAGKPVIALNKGGVAETVVEGVTGEFFKEATMELIADAIGRFKQNEKKYDYLKIRKQAEKFNRSQFVKKMKEVVTEVLEGDSVC